MTYTYDGDGRRVKKSTETLYWYGGGNSPLLQTDTSGETFSYHGRPARGMCVKNHGQDARGTAGSSRVILQYGMGAPCYNADFGPYGKEAVYTNTCAQTYKFTGKERDAETGNDDFGARYGENNLGKFMSPDPIMLPNQAGGGSELANPQRWNKYSYALNNPLAHVDPNGMWSTAVHNQIIDDVFSDKRVASVSDLLTVGFFPATTNPQSIKGRLTVAPSSSFTPTRWARRGPSPGGLAQAFRGLCFCLSIRRQERCVAAIIAAQSSRFSYSAAFLI